MSAELRPQITHLGGGWPSPPSNDWDSYQFPFPASSFTQGATIQNPIPQILSYHSSSQSNSTTQGAWVPPSGDNIASNPRAHSARMTEHDADDREALNHGRTELVSANDNQHDLRRNLHKKYLVKQRQQRKNRHRLKIRQEEEIRIVDNAVKEWEFSGIQAVERAPDGSLRYLIEWEPTWGTISDLSGPAAMEIAKAAVAEAFGTQAWEVDQTSFRKHK